MHRMRSRPEVPLPGSDKEESEKDRGRAVVEYTWVGLSQRGGTLRFLRLKQAMCFEVRKEFTEVAFHGLAVRAELPTDFIRDP